MHITQNQRHKLGSSYLLDNLLLQMFTQTLAAASTLAATTAAAAAVWLMQKPPTLDNPGERYAKIRAGKML